MIQKVCIFDSNSIIPFVCSYYSNIPVYSKFLYYKM